MSRPLLLIGTSGYAKEIAQIARRIDRNGTIWNSISYVSTSRAEIGTELLFGRIDYCDDDVLSGDLAADVVIALGEPHLRVRVAERYSRMPSLAFPNLIDPSADLDMTLITMGTGNVIHRNVVMTFGIGMGDFNFMNKCATVGHDVKMGSFNTINPSASVLSNTHIGNGCMIGAHACVLPRLKIADRTTLGAAALLRNDVDEPGHVFVGIPAKKMR